MKFIFIIIVFIASSLANAAGYKIAVLDYERAIQGTQAVQLSAMKLDEAFAPQKQQAQQLAEELKAIEENFKKEELTLTVEKKEKLQLEVQSKLYELKAIEELYNKRITAERQKILQDMMPKISVIVEAIIKEEGYDIVLSKAAIVFSKPEYDITRKVTEQLDQAKTK